MQYACTVICVLFCCVFFAANCSSSQFPCNSGECVTDSYRCDDYNHCRDGSDEDGCGMSLLQSDVEYSLCKHSVHYSEGLGPSDM